MADPELVKILKQGSEVWNRWREQQPENRDFNLSGINLSRADLSCADLSRANLFGASFVDAKLRNASLAMSLLSRAHLCNADFTRATMSQADLSFADITNTNLNYAEITGANLVGADLSFANLDYADLSSTNLIGVQFIGNNLINTNLARSKIGSMMVVDGYHLPTVAHSVTTTFANVDLRNTKGLAEIEYIGSSNIQLHTVQLPQDGSAIQFLHGAGVPDEWINDYLVRRMYPIQYHSCFISYSSKDEALAKRLHSDLQVQGVPCWFAPHDMKIGACIRPALDQAIHQQEKLLLLLSQNSIKSAWVEDEVEAALERERGEHREILFPIRLDNAVTRPDAPAWAKRLRRQVNIGDFTNWNDSQAYQRALERLLHDLIR